MKQTPSPRSSAPAAQSSKLSASLIASAIFGALFAVLCVGNMVNASKEQLLSPDFIKYFHPLRYAIAWVALTAILLLYGWISRRVVYIFTYMATLAYALVTSLIGGSYMLTFAMCGLVALMTVLCGRALSSVPPEKKKRELALSPTAGKISVGVAAALIGGGVLTLMIAYHLAYTTSPNVSNSTYIQLMTSLRNAFSFDTTVEFGETVSHMAAHISPIFIVYLPFYALIPSPVTLMVLQVAAVFSAVIPLWLIARRHHLSAGVSALLCGLLCLFPATWSGALGSLHEYALLLPLLLWLLWALESRRRVLVWVFAGLCLSVRETVAIHLFAVGIYWLIANRRSAEADGESRRTERIKGWILAGASALFLIVSLMLLSKLGRGTLLTRYNNVTGPYGTFYDSFLREIFCNPALLVYEMLTEAKLYYVLTLLLPLGLLPFFARRREGLIFLFPLLFLNLLPDFSLHYNIDFPYSFGVTAFGFYLAVLSLEAPGQREDKGVLARRLLAVAVTSTLILSAYCVADKAVFTEYAFGQNAEVEAMDELLEKVDADASVSASGRLRPHLSNREELYRLEHEVMTDLVVLDLRDGWALSAEKKYDKAYYMEKGYRVIAETAGVGVILGK